MPDVVSPHSWAHELAEKIRHNEAANIDESVERRAIEHAALIRKSLALVPVAMKAAFLDELDTHFPAPPSSDRPAAQAPAAAKEPALAAIRARLPELSSADRNEVLRDLLTHAFRDSQAGTRLGRMLLDGPRRSSASSAPLPPLDPERTLRLLEVFTETVLSLQRLSIELWREASARKVMGAPVLISDSDFRAAVVRCLTGDPETPPTMIEQEIERQRKAISAAMALLGPFAETYVQTVMKPVSPESIAARAKGDAFSVFGNREAGYWKQFCLAWDGLDQAHFDTVFYDCLSKHLRTLSRSSA